MHELFVRTARAVGLALGVTLALAATAPASELAVGSPAPAFDLPTLDGGRAALEDYRGKIVVLHFGTGW